MPIHLNALSNFDGGIWRPESLEDNGHEPRYWEVEPLLVNNQPKREFFLWDLKN